MARKNVVDDRTRHFERNAYRCSVLSKIYNMVNEVRERETMDYHAPEWCLPDDEYDDDEGHYEEEYYTAPKIIISETISDEEIARQRRRREDYEIYSEVIHAIIELADKYKKD